MSAAAKDAPAEEVAATKPIVADTVNVAEGVAYPKKYYEYKYLDLHYDGKSDRSVDKNGSEKYKTAQNAPLDYVSQLQKDLIDLGYLPAKSYVTNKPNDDGYFGGGTRRAVERFQYHAKRLYRMSKSGEFADITKEEIFKGRGDGVCDHETALAIREWVDKSWVVPLGRVKIVQFQLPSGHTVKLREDAAEAWKEIVETVTALGGTLDGPYGDSLRPLSQKASDGASAISLHYTGRAVDLCQPLADQGNRHYYLEIDPKQGSSRRPYWKIHCSTEKEPNLEKTIVKFETGDKICVNLGQPGKTYRIPEGNYIDLTGMIMKGTGFARIQAKNNWEGKVWKRAEWWHFQYMPDLQRSWLDEMEAIGISEATLVKNGWSLDLMDKKPK